MRPIRYLVFFMTFFISAEFAHAQLRVGLNGGVVLSSLVRDSNINLNAGSVGYMVGALVKYNVGDLGWFIQSGVNYSQEGDSELTLNFVKVPLVLGFDFSDDVNFHVLYNLAWQVGNDNNAQENLNGFANILGLGVEIYFSKKLGGGLRLNYGLSNLVKDPAEVKNFNVKPFTLELYLSYYIF